MWYNQIKAAQPDKQAGEFQTYAVLFRFLLLPIQLCEPFQFIAILGLIC